MSLKKKSLASDIDSKKMKTGHWCNGLKASMHDPDLVIESDELIVVIKDKYPKARHHYLILPKEEINTIKDLKKDHLSLLKTMHSKAEELISKSGNGQNFRIGYHAVPSMRHLHLHVISQDFDSPCLKTKTHWNSFTTEYFVDSKDIMKQLEEHGSVKLMDPNVAKELLAQPLRSNAICDSNLEKFSLESLKCQTAESTIKECELLASELLQLLKDKEVRDKMQKHVDSTLKTLVNSCKEVLKCHVCKAEMKNLPKLKDHIKTHVNK